MMEIMAAFSSVHIIYNPKSTGPSQQRAQKLQSKLQKSLSVPVTCIATKSAGHAKEIAYSIAKNNSRTLIVSSSGDGGYNEVINGALQAQREGCKPICAVLPAGNANDHRTFTSQQPLVRAIKKGVISHIDVMELEAFAQNGSKILARYAHSYIGFGLNSHVVNEVNQIKTNFFKEFVIITKLILRHQPTRVRTKHGKKEYSSLIFANIGRIAKVFKIKGTNTTDGLFEVISIPHTTRLSVIALLFRSSLQGSEYEEQTGSYTFTTLEAMKIQIDGEVEKLPKNAVVTVSSKQQLLSVIQ